MKRNLLLVAALAATLTTTHAATLLDAPAHADIGVGFDPMGSGNARWDLHIHKEEPMPDEEFAPDEAIFSLNANSAFTSPGGLFEPILGPAGTPVWRLPQSLNPNLLFLGVGAEEIVEGLFVGNQITLSLDSVNGPGEFAMYQTDGFGTPTAFFNTRDGVNGSDVLIVPAAGHDHYSFVFSEAGTYTVNLKASGTLVVGNELTESDIASYTFQVVPEPSTWALLVGGAATLGVAMRRRFRVE